MNYSPATENISNVTLPENPRGPAVVPKAKADGRPAHMRSRSMTSSQSYASKIPFTERDQTYRRVRASSVLEKPAEFDARRSGGLSHSRFVPSQPTPSTLLYVATDEQEMLGSFAPTSRARSRLRSLLSTELCAGPKPRPSLFVHTGPGSSWLSSATFSNTVSPFTLSRPHSPVVPSISRTPSPYFDNEAISSPTSSAGPSTPARSLAGSPVGTTRSLHSVLETLEDASKFCVRTCCSTCRNSGSNFPCCPKCGDMWCSRDCRLHGNNGKRHQCRGSRA